MQVRFGNRVANFCQDQVELVQVEEDGADSRTRLVKAARLFHEGSERFEYVLGFQERDQGLRILD